MLISDNQITLASGGGQCVNNIQNNKYDISVLVAVYNVEQNLRECLDSLAAQTLTSAELIIIDEGSTDSSSAICDSYLEKDSRFRVVHQNNLGLVEVRKIGIEQARGRYCIFVDGDDFLVHPRVLEQLKEIAEKESVDILQFRVETLAPSNEQLKQFHSWFDPKINSQTIYSSYLILSKCFIDEKFRWTLWDKIYRTDILKKAARFSVNEHFVAAEDIYLFFKIAYFSTSFKSIETEPLYGYRLGTGVSTKEVSLRAFEFYAKEILLVGWLRSFLESENQVPRYEGLLEKLTNQLIDTLMYRLEQLPVSYRVQAWDLIRKYSSIELLMPQLYVHFCGREEELLDSLKGSKSLCNAMTTVKVIGIFYHRLYEGGVERSIAQQINLFIKMGYKIVLFLEDSVPNKEYKIPSCVYKVILPKSYIENRAFVFGKTIEKFQIDVLIHHASNSENYLYDLLLIKSKGVAVITIRNELSMCGMLWHDHSLIKRIHTVQLTDVLIVLSKMEEAFYRALGVRAQYIPNLIEYCKNNKQPSSRASKTVLWVGRLDWIKNYEEALQIMEKLVKIDSSINCVIVGGEYTQGSADYVKNYIHEHNLEHLVHWEGSKSNVDEYYARASVLLITSRAESFSMTIAEGMAHGIPIVCYRLPYLELIKNNKGVISVDQHDVNAAVDEIVRVLSSDREYDKYSTASLCAFNKFVQFNWIEAWEDVLTLALSSRSDQINEKKDIWEFLDTSFAFYQESTNNLPVRWMEDSKITDAERIRLYRYERILNFIHKFLPENSYRKKIVKAILRPVFCMIK